MMIKKTKDAASEKGDLFGTYIWGEDGICRSLKKLAHSSYGEDLVLILFQFYLNPIPEQLAGLKKVQNYRKGEKSIGIPIIVTDDNFFSKPDTERRIFLQSSILQKFSLLEGIVQKKKLDTDIRKLKKDLESILPLAAVNISDVQESLQNDATPVSSVEPMMKYQLVFQWPASTNEDYLAMVSIENDLIKNLSPASQVDGHDFGSGKMNVFIFTDNPQNTFIEAQAVLENNDLWKSVRAAYREVDGSEYKVLWPIDLKEFDVA